VAPLPPFSRMLAKKATGASGTGKQRRGKGNELLKEVSQPKRRRSVNAGNVSNCS